MFLEDHNKFVLPEVKTDPVAECLLRAAQRIRERGWCQYFPCDESKRLCLLGAIFDLRRPVDSIVWGDHSMDMQNAGSFMLKRGQDGNWNDAPSRTAAEVIAALEDAAADILKAK